jgi:hypothetical protein
MPLSAPLPLKGCLYSLADKFPSLPLSNSTNLSSPRRASSPQRLS